MDVRVGLWRKLSTEELMLLNCGVPWRRLLRVPWTARRSNQSILKEISPGISLEGTMLRLKLQYFGHLMRRVDSLEKTDAGKDWGQEEKWTTEDEMAGWHHWLDGHESEWTPGVDDGQGGLACCDSWGRKESDRIERLNWTELNWVPPIRKPPQASYPYPSEGRQNKNHSHRRSTKLITWITALTNSMKLWSCPVVSPKTDRSWWTVLTKHDPLEKGMVNHFSILALRMPWTIWKGKKIWH